MGCGGFLQLGVMGFEWIDLIQLLYYSPEHLALVGWRFLLQLALTLMGIGFVISPKYLGTTIRTGAIGALITISLTGTLASFHLQALLGFDWLIGIILFGASVLTLIGSIMKYGEIKERLGKSKWTRARKLIGVLCRAEGCGLSHSRSQSLVSGARVVIAHRAK